MPHWAKVVIYPLGFAGFALFLLYRLSATVSFPVWVFPTAAFISLLGGIFLAYLDRSARRSLEDMPTRRPGTYSDPDRPDTRQTAHGDSSPNIANVEGGVNLTYGGGRPSTDRGKE